MNYLSLSHFGRDLLEASKCENAAFDALCLLEYCTKLSRTQIYSNFENQVIDQTAHQYKLLLERRISGEPLQYILGKWEFMGLDFFVGPGVLIPRPETEILVELTLEKIQHREKPIILDLCAGSGCIGISVAKLCKKSEVYLIEKSPQAFDYLKNNLELYGLENATAIRGDVLKGFNYFSIPRPDIILSNPPYIPTAHLESLQTEIFYEPKMALDGGTDGLNFYQAYKELWLPSINSGGLMAVECGDGQADDIFNSYKQSVYRIELKNDLSGIARVVIVYIN